MATIAQCLQRSEELALLSDSADFDVQLLLAFAIKQSRSYLFTWPERRLSAQSELMFADLMTRRKTGEPVAYLTGQQGFWSLNLKVTTDTLIPRPETELLVEAALSLCEKTKQYRILDLGTGSGAIAIALAKELPVSQVIGVDIDAASVALAQENARNNKVENTQFLQSSWFDNVVGKFDLIVSNPPYIDEADEHLSQGDVRFEPKRALVAANKGLSDLQSIIAQAKLYLQAGGALLVEHGYDQKQAVDKLFGQNGFSKIKCLKDIAGQDRVTVGLSMEDK